MVVALQPLARLIFQSADDAAGAVVALAARVEASAARQRDPSAARGEDGAAIPASALRQSSGQGGSSRFGQQRKSLIAGRFFICCEDTSDWASVTGRSADAGKRAWALSEEATGIDFI